MSKPPAKSPERRARLEHAPQQLRDWIEVAGGFITDGFHVLGLFAIAVATVWAAGNAYLTMMAKGTFTVEDLLLLFIYLEIGAMIGIYFKTNRLPVRFLIYVALTALTRHMIGVINAYSGLEHKVSELEYNTIILAGAIMLLAIAVLVLRFGSYQYPSEPSAAYGTDLKAARKTPDARDRTGEDEPDAPRRGNGTESDD
ncbi:MAG: phosphate-starvation-inducible PsiE family protein [Pseudomonadota bacterium]